MKQGAATGTGADTEADYTRERTGVCAMVEKWKAKPVHCADHAGSGKRRRDFTGLDQGVGGISQGYKNSHLNQAYGMMTGRRAVAPAKRDDCLGEQRRGVLL